MHTDLSQVGLVNKPNTLELNYIQPCLDENGLYRDQGLEYNVVVVFGMLRLVEGH